MPRKTYTIRYMLDGLEYSAAGIRARSESDARDFLVDRLTYRLFLAGRKDDPGFRILSVTAC